jgi:hypothetical protein
MSEEKALVPIDQRTVLFYDDELVAVKVEDGTVYVPVRPICDYLGVDWSGQYRRINRDPVLSEEAMSVAITATDIEAGSRQPRTSEMIALPIDYLNGWLFGINTSRVKEEIRERLIQYQRECYRVLADAFLAPASTSALVQVREMGLAIARLAEEQMAMEQRLTIRLDKAAMVVGDLRKRVGDVERRLQPGSRITEEQASEVKSAVAAVAANSSTTYQAVFGELHRRFGVTSYKNIRIEHYEAVLDFLENWPGDDV